MRETHTEYGVVRVCREYVEREKERDGRERKREKEEYEEKNKIK